MYTCRQYPSSREVKELRMKQQENNRSCRATRRNEHVFSSLQSFVSDQMNTPAVASNRIKSQEPELVMPSIHVDSLDSSTDASITSTGSRAARALKRSNRTKSAGSGLKSSSETSDQRSITADCRKDKSTNQNNWEFALKHISTWLFDVCYDALRVLKKPLSFFLAGWLLYGVTILVSNLVTDSVYASLAPICRFPVASSLDLPFCATGRLDTRDRPTQSVEFDQLMLVQSKLEEVLDSAGGISLPMDMKRGEASIRDLRELVRYSYLQSKNELVHEFDGFIETAKLASYDLQRFNSHVGQAVDAVISTTRWTTRVLDGIQERYASRSLLTSFIDDKILAPFQPVKFTENLLLEHYTQHTRLIEEEILKLISEAQALLFVLTNLEDRLDIIHGIATRDGMHAQARKDEILAELWSMVGGNRNQINKMDSQLHLLKQVGWYQKSAFAHVSGTIVQLQAISSGLEDLRERVGAPQLLRDHVDVPLAVHIDNIQKAVERLEESRTAARKKGHEQIKNYLMRIKEDGFAISG